MAASDKIVISGAREHNLKDVDVVLPRDALIVITGLSGSAPERTHLLPTIFTCRHHALPVTGRQACSPADALN